MKTRIAGTVEVELAAEVDRLAKDLGEDKVSYVLEVLLRYAIDAVKRGDLAIQLPADNPTP